MKMHQKDFRKLDLPEFKEWILFLLKNELHERLISAVCFCFKEWRKSSEANSNRTQVNSKLRNEIERLRLSNNRLQFNNPLQAELEQLIAPGLKPKSKLTTAEAEIEQLKRLNRSGLAILEHYAKENRRLIENSIQWEKQFNEVKGYCLEWRESNEKSRDANNKMWAAYKLMKERNQTLKQHLATYHIPVPGNPGMAFISYPN